VVETTKKTKKQTKFNRIMEEMDNPEVIQTTKHKRVKGNRRYNRKGKKTISLNQSGDINDRVEMTNNSKNEHYPK
jgi:hypothetical protein